jgi:hypothetical protein
VSGLRDTHLVQAYRLMHAHDIDTTSIAAAVGTGRAYVSRVLTGQERRGRTWLRIRTWLLERVPEAVAELDQVPCDARPVQMTTFRATPRSHDSEGSPAGVDAGERGTVGAAPVAPANTARPTIRAFTHWRQRSA